MESGLCFQITAGTVTAPRWVQGSKNVHSLRGLRSELWLTGQTTCLIFISCVSRVPIWWMRLSVNSLGEAPSGRGRPAPGAHARLCGEGLCRGPAGSSRLLARPGGHGGIHMALWAFARPGASDRVRWFAQFRDQTVNACRFLF